MVRRKWSLKGLALAAAFSLAAIGVLTFYVWYQTESVKLGLDIANGERRISELETAIEALKLRRAELLDPGRVESIARGKLGLIDPADGDILFRKLAPPR
jgi:cell division protein FtsL